MNPRQELLGDPGNGNVPDIDLLIADQRQQEIERSTKPIELDDERRRREPRRETGR